MLGSPVKVKLVAINHAPESTIAYAARVCYASHGAASPEKDEALIKKLRESRHESVLEHSFASFEIECSRVVSHELVRHRIAAYSQRSQRYVKESEPEYMIPSELDEPEVRVFIQAMERAWDAYNTLLNMGVQKQIARYVLPNACRTRLVMSTNFREWRHVIQLRLSKQAQPEMQHVAASFLTNLYHHAPMVFEDLMPLLDEVLP